MATNAETQQSDNDQGDQSSAKEGGPYFWDKQLPAPNGLISQDFSKKSAESQKQAAMKFLKFIEDDDKSKYPQVNEIRDPISLLFKVPGRNKF